MNETDKIKELVVQALDDLKALDMEIIDVRGKSTVTDFMVIVSGTSDRHVKAMASNLVEEAKKRGYRPLGVEGENQGDWVLVDLGEVVAHVMLPSARDFYQLDKLWQGDFGVEAEAETDAEAGQGSGSR